MYRPINGRVLRTKKEYKNRLEWDQKSSGKHKVIEKYKVFIVDNGILSTLSKMKQCCVTFVLCEPTTITTERYSEIKTGIQIIKFYTKSKNRDDSKKS